MKIQPIEIHLYIKNVGLLCLPRLQLHRLTIAIELW